jgi:hypothetical protein
MNVHLGCDEWNLSGRILEPSLSVDTMTVTHFSSKLYSTAAVHRALMLGHQKVLLKSER